MGVNFASKTIETGDGNLDEILNEDITCEIDIFTMAQSTVHVSV